MKDTSAQHYKLGIFVLTAIALFAVGIYFIGVNRNLFGANFELQSEFKNVSGLKQGSNVRLSGINIGTVYKIEFISDSLVLVKLLIKKEVQPYIKTDAVASIGSDGLVGDKVLIIAPGTNSHTPVQDHDVISSFKTIEIEDILSSVQKSARNTEIITHRLIDFSGKMNNPNGLLSQVMTNKALAQSISKTLHELETSSREIARFTPYLNDHNGLVWNALTNKSWTNRIESSLYSLQNSAQNLDTLTAQSNQPNNVLHQIIGNDSIAKSVARSIAHLEKSTAALAQFTTQLNQEDNVLSKLINNPKLAKSVDTTLTQLEQRVKDLKELEEAAKSNLFLKGYFNKKKKASQK